MYNLKNIKAEFKSKGIFYTQPELAEYVKSLVDIEVRDVYDPTCGDGGLLCVFDDNIQKFGQEINDHQIEVAKGRLKNFIGVCGDTLISPAFMDRRFSCIVANPPFSIKWCAKSDERFINAPSLPPNGKADYAFLLHIIHLLADDGIAVVLNFPGVLYRGNSEGRIRRWMVENNWIDKVIQIPAGMFVDTKISTAIIVFRKNKKTTDVSFIDVENNLSRTVPVSEIVENDYTLAVGTYVQEEVEKIIIDAADIQAKSRSGMIKKLISDIEMDKIICELEGFDFNEYIDDLIKTIQSFKN